MYQISTVTDIGNLYVDAEEYYFSHKRFRVLEQLGFNCPFLFRVCMAQEQNLVRINLPC